MSDDGDGIAKEMQPLVFEPLRQAQNAEKGGLGLGLAIVKQLVAMHRGSVAVQSDGAGKGSRFTVELPLASSVLALFGPDHPRRAEAMVSMPNPCDQNVF